MYRLPKVHKENTPIRPIISAVKAYNYKLAKWLDELLKPLTESSKYTIKDTFNFVNKIRDLGTYVDKHLVSFDVESLFTNIPTRETIDFILDRAFKANETFHNLTRDVLDKLLVTCAQMSHFQFDGEFYDQVDGVAMGSPLGPLFASMD